MQKTLQNEYFHQSIESLITFKPLVIFLLAIETLLTLINFMDILPNNSSKFINFLYFSDANQNDMYFYIFLGKVLDFYILYLKSPQIKNKIYQKIFINLLEYLHLRTLLIFYMHYIFNTKIFLLVGILFTLLLSYIVIYHVNTYHLYLYCPQIILNDFPFDSYSALLDTAHYIVKIIISMANIKEGKFRIFFIILIIAILVVMSLYTCFIMIFKSYYILNNLFINKYRIILLFFLTVSFIFNLIFNSKDSLENLIIIVEINLFIFLIILLYAYNPYTHMKYNRDFLNDNTEEKNIIKLFLEFQELHYGIRPKTDIAQIEYDERTAEVMNSNTKLHKDNNEAILDSEYTKLTESKFERKGNVTMTDYPTSKGNKKITASRNSNLNKNNKFDRSELVKNKNNDLSESNTRMTPNFRNAHEKQVLANNNLYNSGFVNNNFTNYNINKNGLAKSQLNARANYSHLNQNNSNKEMIKVGNMRKSSKNLSSLLNIKGAKNNLAFHREQSINHLPSQSNLNVNINVKDNNANNSQNISKLSNQINNQISTNGLNLNSQPTSPSNKFSRQTTIKKFSPSRLSNSKLKQLGTIDQKPSFPQLNQGNRDLTNISNGTYLSNLGINELANQTTNILGTGTNYHNANSNCKSSIIQSNFIRKKTKKSDLIILSSEEVSNDHNILGIDSTSEKFDYYELIFEILYLIKKGKDKSKDMSKSDFKKKQNINGILKEYSNSIQFCLLKLAIKYSKSNQLLMRNLYSIYAVLFSEYHKFIKDFHTMDKSTNLSIKNVNVDDLLPKLVLLNIVNDFLNVSKIIFDKLTYLLSDYMVVKYEDYIKFSNLLGKLKNKKFNPILKNKSNSYSYTLLISLIIYEELFNIALGSDGLQIRDNIFQYELMMKTHYKSCKDILMTIDITDFEAIITYVGRELSEYLNRNFIHLFPNEFRNLQTSIFRKKILHQKNNQRQAFFFIIKGNNNIPYHILYLKCVLFCYDDHILLFGTYTLMNYSFITKINIQNINYLTEDFDNEEKMVGVCFPEIEYENEGYSPLSLNEFLIKNKLTLKDIEKLEELSSDFSNSTVVNLYRLTDLAIKKLTRKKGAKNSSNKSSKKFDEYQIKDSDDNLDAFKNEFIGSESSVKNYSLNSRNSVDNFLVQKKKNKNSKNNLNIKYIYQNIAFASFIVWIIFFFIELKHMNKISANFFGSYDIYLALTDTYRNYFEILPGVIVSSCLLFEYDKNIDELIKANKFSCNGNNVNNFLDSYNINFNAAYNATINITQLIFKENLLKNDEFKSNINSLKKLIYNYNDKDTNSLYNKNVTYHKISSSNSKLKEEENVIQFNQLITDLFSKLNEILIDGSYLELPIFAMKINSKKNGTGDLVYEYDFTLANSYSSSHKSIISIYDVILNFNVMVQNGILMQNMMYKKMSQTYHYYTSMEYMYVCVLYAYDVLVMFIIFLHIKMYERAMLILINSIRYKCFLSQYEIDLNKSYVVFNKAIGKDKEIKDFSFQAAFMSKIQNLRNLSKLYIHPTSYIINQLNSLYYDYRKITKEQNRIKALNEKMKNAGEGNYNYGTNFSNPSTDEANVGSYVKAIENQEGQGNTQHQSNKDCSSYADHISLGQNVESNNDKDKNFKPTKENVLFNKVPLNKYRIIFYIFFIVCPIEYFIFLMLWFVHFTDTEKTFNIIHKSIYAENILNIGFNLFQIMYITNQTLEDSSNWMGLDQLIYLELNDALKDNIELSGKIKDLDHLIKMPSKYVNLDCDHYFQQTENKRMQSVLNDSKQDEIDLAKFCNNTQIMQYQDDFNFIYSYHYSNVLNLLSLITSNEVDYIKNLLMNSQYISNTVFHLFIFFPFKTFIRNVVFVDWVNKVQNKINLLFEADTAIFVSFVGLLLIALVGIYMIMLRYDYLNVLNMNKVFDINKGEE